MSAPEGHGLDSLPVIEVQRDAPHLHAHQLVKIEVSYSCRCGETVRTSEVVPAETLIRDVPRFTALVRQVTANSRVRWEEHRRG